MSVCVCFFLDFRGLFRLSPDDPAGQGAMHPELFSLHMSCVFFDPLIPGVTMKNCYRKDVWSRAVCGVFPWQDESEAHYKHIPLLSLTPAVCCFTLLHNFYSATSLKESLDNLYGHLFFPEC